MRYLPVDVYVRSNGGDCSLNGVSKTHSDKLVVECLNGHITKEDVKECGYIVLEFAVKNIGPEPYKYLKPKGETRWVMFGGNYASTSDSRFSPISRYPLPIHDRIEG